MASKDEKENSVPTGSEPVDNSGTSKNNQNDGNQQTSDSQSQSSTDQTQSSQDKGSNKTEGADQAGASDQQSTGQMSTEELLQTLQKSQQDIEQVNQKLDSMQKPSDDGQSQEPDYESQLGELDRMLKSGEINLDEYQVRQRGIMEEKSKQQANDVVEQRLEQQKMEQATEDYMKSNPDFEQYYNSKEMQQLMKSNPLMDEVGAYERLKRSEAESKVSELNQQIEQLQKERDNAVKNGAAVTDTVGKDSGAALQHGEIENNKNLGPQEGMMAALQRTRQAQ